jgi:hypothetical protein
MAGRITYYGNIVKDGLVLLLDAAKKDSYPGSGTLWRDVSGNGNNGTLINGPTFNSNNGGYISCDGTNDFIEVSDNSILDFGTTNFTLEYWFRKLQTTIGFDNIWGPNKWNTGGGPGGNEWSIAIGNGIGGNGDNYSFTVEVGTTSYSTGQSSEVFTINQWYQLVAMRDGGSLKTFVGGTLKQNVSPIGFSSSSSINNVGRTLRVGNSFLNQYYTAADTSVLRIYNRALSAQEVLQNYNATKGRYL